MNNATVNMKGTYLFEIVISKSSHSLLCFYYSQGNVLLDLCVFIKFGKNFGHYSFKYFFPASISFLPLLGFQLHFRPFDFVLQVTEELIIVFNISLSMLQFRY